MIRTMSQINMVSIFYFHISDLLLSIENCNLLNIYTSNFLSLFHYFVLVVEWYDGNSYC